MAMPAPQATTRKGVILPLCSVLKCCELKSRAGLHHRHSINFTAIQTGNQFSVTEAIWWQINGSDTMLMVVLDVFQVMIKVADYKIT